MRAIDRPDHPLWKILRMLVVGGFVLASLWMFYDRLDNRDLMTILTAMAGVLGYDLTKAKMTGSKKEKQDDLPEVES